MRKSEREREIEREVFLNLFNKVSTHFQHKTNYHKSGDFQRQNIFVVATKIKYAKFYVQHCMV